MAQALEGVGRQTICEERCEERRCLGDVPWNTNWPFQGVVNFEALALDQGIHSTLHLHKLRQLLRLGHNRPYLAKERTGVVGHDKGVWKNIFEEDAQINTRRAINDE